MQQKIRANLWFDSEAEKAAEFYVSVFPNSKITNVESYPKSSDNAGETMVVEWELDGTPFLGINGGPQFKFDEAVSFEVRCDDQEEIDYYWEKLRDGGGEESMCGWLRDRFGLSWQIQPKNMGEIMGGDDAEAQARAWKAMLKMRKIDIAALEAAAAGETVAS